MDAALNATLGYDLDLGGYAFEYPVEDSPFHGIADLVWESPDLSYFPYVELPRSAGHPDVLLFDPTPYARAEPFPRFINADDCRYYLLASGYVLGSDHGCICDQEGCERCDGNGYIDSPAGHYAVYTLRDHPRIRAINAAMARIQAGLMWYQRTR
jgi:hypothetical protein